MKSERRHELQHNELADWLIKTGKAIKPYINLILWAVVIGFGAFVATVWWSKYTTSQDAVAWSELNNGMETRDPTQLNKVIESYPGTQVARTAVVLSGDIRLSDGCEKLFHNKTLGEQQLSKAITLYEAERREGKNSMLLERATFGLARAKEARGELNEAERFYREVVANWPQGAYAAAATERLEDLKRPEIKQLYDDFRTFEPKPAFTNEFDVPGKQLEFDKENIPKEKSIEYPDLDTILDKEKKKDEQKK